MRNIIDNLVSKLHIKIVFLYTSRSKFPMICRKILVKAVFFFFSLINVIYRHESASIFKHLDIIIILGLLLVIPVKHPSLYPVWKAGMFSLSETCDGQVLVHLQGTYSKVASLFICTASLVQLPYYELLCLICFHSNHSHKEKLNLLIRTLNIVAKHVKVNMFGN